MELLKILENEYNDNEILLECNPMMKTVNITMGTNDKFNKSTNDHYDKITIITGTKIFYLTDVYIKSKDDSDITITYIDLDIKYMRYENIYG